MAASNNKPMVPPSTAPTMAVFDFLVASAVTSPEVALVDERTMDVLTDVPIVITTAEDDAGEVNVVVIGILLLPLLEFVEVLVAVDEAAPDEDELILERADDGADDGELQDLSARESECLRGQLT